MGKKRLVGEKDEWEGECGVGCQEYQFCSSPEGPRYVEAEVKDSRCMGIQNH